MADEAPQSCASSQTSAHVNVIVRQATDASCRKTLLRRSEVKSY